MIWFWPLVAIGAAAIATHYYRKASSSQAQAQGQAPAVPAGVVTCTYDRRHGGSTVQGYPCPGKCPSTWSDAEWYAYGVGWADVKASKAADSDWQSTKQFGTTQAPERPTVVQDMIDNYSNLPSSAAQRMQSQSAKDSFFNGFYSWWAGAYDAEWKYLAKQ